MLKMLMISAVITVTLYFVVVILPGMCVGRVWDSIMRDHFRDVNKVKKENDGE